MSKFLPRHKRAIRAPYLPRNSMDLNAWTEGGVDRVRAKRLGIGYAVGIAFIVGLFAFLTAASARQEVEEEELDVELAQLPEEKADEPEPEPEPEPELAPEPVAANMPVGPRATVPKLETPTEIPDDKPAEEKADPSSLGGGDSDPYGKQGAVQGDVRRAAPKAAPKVASKPKPTQRRAKPKVVRVTEDVQPPVALSQPRPSYPSSAKDRGIEGTVIVKYVVTASGAVANVRAVRGPQELRGVCVAAVQAWRFKPAVLNGNAVSVYRIARFPFRIKT